MRKRIRNLKNQKHSALLRFIRRIIMKIAGIRLSKQTEIQYINPDVFKSRVISVKKIEDSINIKKKQSKDIFEHNFNTKYLVTLSNVVVNTDEQHRYRHAQCAGQVGSRHNSEVMNAVV